MALECRDESQLVALEAVRAIAGCFPPRNAKLSLDGSAANDEASDLRMRGRAWSVSAALLRRELHSQQHNFGLAQVRAGPRIPRRRSWIEHRRNLVNRAPLQSFLTT